MCCSTLCAANKVLKAVNSGQEQAQINTLYMLQHWSAQEHYMAVQSDTVSTQFHLVLDAPQEKKKFVRLL